MIVRRAGHVSRTNREAIHRAVVPRRQRQATLDARREDTTKRILDRNCLSGEWRDVGEHAGAGVLEREE